MIGSRSPPTPYLLNIALVLNDNFARCSDDNDSRWDLYTNMNNRDDDNMNMIMK